eukprot:CAMPEP_0170461486 /NCGR_PEP_ID=MMETSP0123-20130129/7370_1 /TAXON_ID=182087 /ORGANISM="Favella ehrenbergii, Strain Fehren 1" /LENGTH=33 /DNA_ID= /DNA_START= /DNA_END= /DNA_ORIENTATION=
MQVKKGNQGNEFGALTDEKGELLELFPRERRIK